MTSQDFWPIRTKSNVDICVWPNPNQMSAYILLEQEEWFEDEMDFVRTYVTPDMNALDIGANHGVYALNIAARAPQGKVWAFEPTLAAGSMLEKSITRNGFTDRLRWIHAGLSDHAGSGQLATSLNTELSTLQGHIHGNSKSETIQLFTLDGFIDQENITAPIGFVKLDVEGEEINVLHGGQQFFERQSPLVMFELKHGDRINHELIQAFQAMGYGIYRLVHGLGILTDDTDTFQDDYLLNLFACKADRRDELRARGLLATRQEAHDWTHLHPLTIPDWQELLQQAYAQAFSRTWCKSTPPETYLLALTASLQARDTQRGAIERLARLHEAINLLDHLNTNTGDENLAVAVALTRLSLLHWSGERVKAVVLSRELISAVSHGAEPTWPFVVPLEDFAHTPPAATPTQWLLACLTEFMQRRHSFSSYFVGESIATSQLINQPDQPLSAFRRALLVALRSGETDGDEITLPAGHSLLEESRSPNAAIWRMLVRTRDEETRGIPSENRSSPQIHAEPPSLLGRTLSALLGKIINGK